MQRSCDAQLCQESSPQARVVVAQPQAHGLQPSDGRRQQQVLPKACWPARMWVSMPPYPDATLTLTLTLPLL